jgi:ParB family chromosome partitioning protein
MTETSEVRPIKSIPVSQIRILNPRVRNKRNFKEIVENIARIGLKRPITVSRRTTNGEESYDLICGQGRLEAFMQLGQSTIPAVVMDAKESECLVMSLVENCARRQHRAIDLLQDVGTLRKRGYTDSQIAEKIGVSPEYVYAIAQLIDNGEERLLTAVEAGTIPLTLRWRSLNLTTKSFSGAGSGLHGEETTGQEAGCCSQNH